MSVQLVQPGTETAVKLIVHQVRFPTKVNVSAQLVHTGQVSDVFHAQVVRCGTVYLVFLLAVLLDLSGMVQNVVLAINALNSTTIAMVNVFQFRLAVLLELSGRMETVFPMEIITVEMVSPTITTNVFQFLEDVPPTTHGMDFLVFPITMVSALLELFSMELAV